ncbi:TonB-dependent receptor [Chitinophaga caeni]|uniref:TonB-dependent receptor n=1 Tax=Chitinophaga caeni TaxID=2029983 RepID=A0A291QPC0_9BACT|nr:TonB-dependent receptor [Chitinophaga caeni]ATL45849.1 TonB-dependent receptor [Chitinophaga caeni]
MKPLYRFRIPITQLLFILLGLMLSAAESGAQQVVRGLVNDGNGNPLPGATVIIKGSQNAVQTNATGHFEIQAPATVPFSLIISLIGYQNQEVVFYELSDEIFEITLLDDSLLGEIIVTARRRKETAQDVPIPIAVVGGARAAEAGAFNVNRLKELVPSVQLYSSNPRNTALNIRGLGTTFGLTNDGIDPGVGFYVDGVYYARPAATTLDFIDVERIEVLRGPQGTLFGKNTTAGAFNITTKKASFTSGGVFELSYGNYGYIQAKTSVTGPLSKKLAGRLSFVGTQRDGTIYNKKRDEYINDLNNIGVKGQLLYAPSDKTEITLSGDLSRQRPNGYAQIVAGVVNTQRPEYRQFDQIISDLNYHLPTTDPFDRVIDHDTPWRSDQDFGGASLTINTDIGNGTLTSTSAFRYWNWNPSNDRDFTGLQALALSQAPSKHSQWSQEVRYAGAFSSKLSGVIGVFAIAQNLQTDPYHTEESGKDQWRFSQSTGSELWATPGLLDGYGIKTISELNTFSGAVFGQLDWSITGRLHLLPGIRFNYDKKKVDFNRETYGGAQTDDPELIALKKAVYSDQQFNANTDNTNVSGQITLSYKTPAGLNAYATFATNYKPVGLNLGGLPTSNGQPMLELAKIAPEYVQHYELGVKTTPKPGAILNFTIYRTDLKDYQTLVLNSQLGVNRGYLANAEKVRVTGVELDGSIKAGQYLSFRGAVTYTDGKYVRFKEAPVPLEETGGAAFKDASGTKLPGISKWAGSLSSEITSNARNIFKNEGRFFFTVDAYYRSSFSSSPVESRYLNVDGYSILNARAGFRAQKGLSLFIWSRNLLDQDYFEQLLPASGSAGHYAGVLGDPGTFGITLKYSY